MSSKEAPGALHQSASEEHAAAGSSEQAAANGQQPDVHPARTCAVTGLHAATGHPRNLSAGR
jgi:hypothetical protein